MIESYFSVSQKDFLLIGLYAFAVMYGILISLKHKVPPTNTLFVILSGSMAYMIITHFLNWYFQPFFSVNVQSQSSVIILGLFGVILTLRILKSFFRIPIIVVHKLLMVLFSLLLLQHFIYYALESGYQTFVMLSLPFTEGTGSWNNSELIESATLFPKHLINNPVFIETFSAGAVLLAYLYFRPRLIQRNNDLTLSSLLLIILLFISLFSVNPENTPMLTDRLLGLSVVQWGLLLTGILLLAHILAVQLDPPRGKKEILRKAPSEYRLFVAYISLTVIAFQVTALFSIEELIILFFGYFITSGFMIVYFMKRMKKSYLRYGTASIILFTCIVFLYTHISEFKSGLLSDSLPVEIHQVHPGAD